MSRRLYIAMSLSLGAGCGDDQATPESTTPCAAPLVSADACATPWLPRWPSLHVGAEWVIPTPAGLTLELGTSTDPAASAPDTWIETDRFTMAAPGPLVVFARVTGAGCAPVEVRHLYAGVEAYSGAAEQPGSVAISKEDARIAGWADGAMASLDPGVGERFRDPAQALGPPAGGAFGVVSLGAGGSVTLTFDGGIGDGPGPDFAVFENGFSDHFLELAYVEVSSDGERFARFPSAYLGVEPIGPYSLHDPELIEGLAGKHRAGFGTPFDLSALARHPGVREGWLQLGAVTHVRVVDVVGDGGSLDAFGNPIFDPYPTEDSVGFDLDAVGVLNQEDGRPPCAIGPPDP